MRAPAARRSQPARATVARSLAIPGTRTRAFQDAEAARSHIQETIAVARDLWASFLAHTAAMRELSTFFACGHGRSQITRLRSLVQPLRATSKARIRR